MLSRTGLVNGHMADWDRAVHTANQVWASRTGLDRWVRRTGLVIQLTRTGLDRWVRRTGLVIQLTRTGLGQIGE